MRAAVLLIVAALSLTGCGTALVATGDTAMPNLMDVFSFQDRCSQESQGDG